MQSPHPYDSTTGLAADLTDQELIQGFLEGRKPEYIRVHGWITAMVRSRLWDNHVAPEDVVADTLMKLLLNLRDESFRLESTLKTYVQRIALYTLVDAGRRRKRLKPIADGNTLSDPSTPHSLLEDEEEQQLIDRAMSMLPESCRRMFEMALHERMKYREIARRLGSTEGAIKTRLSRCRDRIYEIVRQLK
jgi:RNA polymerase sigma-70 factor (ECF subfamily)